LKYDSDNELHRKLSKLSKQAHERAQKRENVSKVEEEIDDVVSTLYGITDESLQNVKETLLIQEGGIPEEEPEVVEEKKPEVHFLNTVVEPMTENQIEASVINPYRDQIRLIVDVFGEKTILKTFNSEENFKIKVGPLEEGEYNLPYKLITPKEEIEGIIVLQVKSVPKHRKGRLSKAFDEFVGEEHE
jgi:hypothetical protein